ncbi:MAG: methyl-accepting chemotaxis protein [Rhodospirillales bacterium]|nr:methyl-accepting chemotaxis protein [Rhodospirillales bacterium]
MAPDGRSGLLARLGVGPRVNLLIALAFGALAALGGSYLAGERRLDAALEHMMERDAAHDLAVGVEALAFRMQLDTKSFLLGRDSDAAVRYQARAAKVTAMLDRLRKGSPDMALNTHVDTVNDGMLQYAAQFRRVAEAPATSSALTEIARLDEILAYIAPGLEALALVTGEAADRAAEEARRTRRIFHILIFAALALIGTLFAVPVFIIGHAIAAPLSDLAEAVRVDDDFIPGATDGDEVDDIARALRILKNNLMGMKSLHNELVDIQRRKDAGEVAARSALAEDLRSRVGAAADTLLAASAGIGIGARTLLDGTEETKRRTAAVSKAARHAATTGEAAAAAVEGVAGSIGEIGQRVARSAAIVGRAATDAKGATRKVQGLDDAIEKIGAVMVLITDIAHQTRLLALNATIEAARAGDAGKGFSQVASEVKTLAARTAASTKDITAHIGEIRSATQSALEAIQGVGGTIGELDGLTADIATFVESEGETGRDAGHSARQAAAECAETTAAAAAMAEIADATGRGIERIMETALDLERYSQSARETVDRLADKMKDQIPDPAPRAATPGRSFPSSHSRKAPPAVET